MQMAIAQNPHVKDPKEMWNIINGLGDDIDPRPRLPEKIPDFDPVGFEIFKAKIGQNPKFTIKPSSML